MVDLLYLLFIGRDGIVCYMSNEIETDKFLFNDYEKEQRARENKKIFDDSELPDILEKFAIQETFSEPLVFRWGENNLSIKLTADFDHFRRNFCVPENEVGKARVEGVTIFEAYLSINNEIIIANKTDEKTELGIKLPKGTRYEITNFLYRKISEEINGKPRDIIDIYPRKKEDTIVVEVSESEEAKPKRFPNLGFIFNK